MKRILTIVLALAVVGYLGCGANAAEIVKAGSEKIAIMGAAHYADVAGDADAYASVFMIAGEYGYMVADQFEMAARAMFALAQAVPPAPRPGCRRIRSCSFRNGASRWKATSRRTSARRPAWRTSASGRRIGSTRQYFP